jgi:hypothetical protein
MREYCVGKNSRGFERFTSLELPVPQYELVPFGTLFEYVCIYLFHLDNASNIGKNFSVLDIQDFVWIISVEDEYIF